MTAIEDFERDLAHTKRNVEILEQKLEELKKPAVPCPLEEGKRVALDNDKMAEWAKEGYVGSVAVEEADNEWHLVIRYPFVDEQAPLYEARRIIWEGSD